jgi:N-methylhydantoinase A
MTAHHQPYRVGVDIGGTFTDLIVVNDETGAFAVGKTLTTPHDPSQAIESVLLDTLLAAGIAVADVKQLIHGTTLVTNAIIERKGARTALLATQGFRDAIEIGREHRYELYDLMLEMPQPLAPRYLRFDVPQRTLADGTTLQALDVAYVERLARELAENDVEAVAIAFLNSFANPAAEREAREAVLRVAPQLRVSISSEVVPEIREFERTSTTLANVYVQGRTENYLRELQARLARLGFHGNFFLMLSSGGIATAETAMRYPVRLLESGPAAGALAAASYGNAMGHADLLSFDMGGTTAKFCVIDRGQPVMAREFEVDRRYRFKKGSGLPIKVPVIEMIELGAGGGSIARVDALGLLKVGPDSAGAEPGPACYGRGGTEPTVTDADLVLGYLDPHYFLGGRLALDINAARQAIQTRIAAPLGIAVEAAAWGMHQIVNENMANAARIHTLERGQDPQQLPVFVFGGAGPVHGFRVATALGSPLLIAPLGAGVTSTVGFLSAPLAFDFVRSWRGRLTALDWAHAESLLAEMQSEGEALLTTSGMSATQIQHRRIVDMRYLGQGHEIRVSLPAGTLSAASVPAVLAAFEAEYLRLYGRLGPPVPIELINWRIVSAGPQPDLRLRMMGHAGGDAQSALKGQRLAYFPEWDGMRETPVYDRYRLSPEATVKGPAIIEECESTLIIGVTGCGRVDANWNLIVTWGESHDQAA